MSDLAALLAGLAPERRALLELLILEEALGARESAPAVAQAGVAPLSYGQERLWLLDRLDPGSAAYNTFTALRLTGPLDLAVLGRSFAEIERRHAVLRTTFREEGGRPVQVVGAPRPVELPVVDLSGLESVLREAVEHEVRQPFDLTRGPLYRVRLFRLGAREHVLVATLHHIVSDAWSMGVLARELTAIHAAFAAGLPSPLPELPLQYADYARGLRERLEGGLLEEQLAWWRERLAGAPEVVEVPPDRPRPRVRRFRGATLSRKLPLALSGQVARLCRERSVTPFMALLAAFEVLLHARSGQTDLVVGVDVANRHPAATEVLLGFFVNQLVLRVDAADDPTWLDLLERVRDAALGAFAHQDLPFGRLVEELSPQRSLARNPLFQVMFGLYNVPAAEVELGDLRMAPFEEMEGGTAVFDLSLYVAETSDGLMAILRYDADLYEASTAERLLADFETVASRVVDAPGERLSALVEYLATERRRRLEAGREELQKARVRMVKTARRRVLDAEEQEESKMTETMNQGPKKLALAGRRNTVAPAGELVREAAGPAGLPLILEPAVAGVDALAWAAANRASIEERLLRHGALLFRGFGLQGIEGLQAFVRAVCGELLEYRERSSPRSELADRVYTSTDYPAEQPIFPHNEHSYARRFPLKLFFACVTPAETGGETPIGDTRRIYQRIDPEIRARFEERGWMYVRNFHPGFGLSWQTVFQTEERVRVEEYCREAGIEWEWRPGDRLRTRQVRPVTARHPRTGETVWFNHATFFHISTLPAAIREPLLRDFGEEDLPNNTWYGDGSPIEPEVAGHLRQAYLSEMVELPWRQGDILLIDNMLTAHARNPFTGPRKVVVAMADPHTRDDV